MSFTSTSDDAFGAALLVVLAHEGGFVDDPADPGGATNAGITLKLLQADGSLDGLDFDHAGAPDLDDLKHLTADQKAAFYRAEFWDRFGYGRIRDVYVATKVFDLAVNMGPAQAHRLVQRAIRAAWLPVTEDGVLGDKTMASLNAAEPRSLHAALKSEAAGFYRALVAARPALGRFLGGWLNRAYS